MIQIQHLPLQKSDLQKLTKEDRVFVIAAGHIYNELNVMTKLLQYAAQSVSSNTVLQHVETAQAIIIARILVGKVFEAWELIKRRVQQNQVRNCRLSVALQEGKASVSYKNLKKTFGNSNSIALIRNNYSFHNPDDSKLEAAFQLCLDNDNWDVVVSATQTNSFYRFSETVIMEGMMGIAKIEKNSFALHEFLNKAVKTAIQINDVMEECIGLIFDTNISDFTERLKDIDFKPLPKLSDIRIPFFVDDKPSDSA